MKSGKILQVFHPKSQRSSLVSTLWQIIFDILTNILFTFNQLLVDFFRGYGHVFGLCLEKKTELLEDFWASDLFLFNGPRKLLVLPLEFPKGNYCFQGWQNFELGAPHFFLFLLLSMTNNYMCWAFHLVYSVHMYWIIETKILAKISTFLIQTWAT